MKNEQGSEPLWRRACLWTYCERIAVQNIKRYEIEPETQIVGIWNIRGHTGFVCYRK